MNIIFFEILSVYQHEEDWFSSIFHGMTLHIFAQQRFLSNFEAANAHCSDSKQVLRSTILSSKIHFDLVQLVSDLV